MPIFPPARRMSDLEDSTLVLSDRRHLREGIAPFP
jgi:hypothetical protein